MHDARGGEVFSRASRTGGQKYFIPYAVVIEKAGSNYSAYVPATWPGCIAAADTVKMAEAEIRDATRLHIEGLKEDGLPVPVSRVALIEP